MTLDEAVPNAVPINIALKQREYKFTLKDILLLINSNVESDEKIVISENSEEDTWCVLPMNSSLLWGTENENKKVANIGVHDGMIQIWLAN